MMISNHPAILTWKRASSPETTGAWDAFESLERLQSELDRWIGWSRYPENSGLFDRSAYPALDVIETAEGCTVWADIPGLDRKDLDLSVTANVLTLKGEKKAPKTKDKDRSRVFRDETWTGSFQRSVSLPDTVDPDKVTAEFRDGILKVTFAKKPEHKPRQIPVLAR
jgi:HSP20 family protein